MSTKSMSRPSSRSEELNPSTKSEPVRSKSTSPTLPKKGTLKNGEHRTKAGSTSNGSKLASKKVLTDSKTPQSTPSGTSMKKTNSPGTAKRLSSPVCTKPVSKGGGGTKSSGDGKSSTGVSITDAARRKNTCSPTGEESKKRMSVVEKKSSPLTQRRTSASQIATKKTSATPGSGKPKSPPHTTSPNTTRRASGNVSRLPRSTVTQTNHTVSKDKKASVGSARKHTTPGKPPTGAHTSTAAKTSSSVKQSSGGLNGKTSNGGKADRAGNNASDKSGDKLDGTKKGEDIPMEKNEGNVHKASTSSGGSSTGGGKSAASSAKTMAVSNKANLRKSSVEKRPRSAGNSPATSRRASMIVRPSGTSGNQAVARRSSSFRRTSSSGTILNHRKGTERKAESVSPPKIESKVSKEKKSGGPSPKTEKRTSSISPKKTSPKVVTNDKRVGSVSQGTGKRMSTVKKGNESFIPTGRRSVRSTSVVTLEPTGLKKNETRSLGRKMSAATAVTSSVGRGSPSPNTLAGKVVILDHSDLKDEDRLQSTLKLFGAKNAKVGTMKTNRGQVIKPMGGGASKSGRVTPVKKTGTTSTQTSVNTGIARTGSGSLIKKANPSNPSSRGRLNSSDDILKSGRLSPAETVAQVRAKSPLVMSAKEKTINESAPTNKDNSERVMSKNPALQRVAGKSGIISRPSCRDTQVKSRIVTWSKKEEEAKKLDPNCVPPMPTSPKSPQTSLPQTTSLSSSTQSSPHVSPATSPPKVPLSASPHSPPLNSSSHAPSTKALNQPAPHSTPGITSTPPSTSPRASRSPPPSSAARPSRSQRSSSAVVIGTTVKSRIAMWAEKERESRESRTSLSPQHSPQHSRHSSSPHVSPESSPKLRRQVKASPESSPKLQRQSPIDKHRISPIRSAESSREGSLDSSKANSASPARQVPSITVKNEGTCEGIVGSPKRSVGASPDDEVYEDVEVSRKHRLLPPIPVSEPTVSTQEDSTLNTAPLIQENLYSTIPEVYSNFPKGNYLHENSEAPKLPPRPDFIKPMVYPTAEGDMHVQDIEDDATTSKSSGTSYTKVKPVYTEISIRDDQEATAGTGSGVQKSVSQLTPRSKRRWLRSPRFGRRKSSGDDKDAEGGSSDREEKKNEGFIRRLKIGSRSNKERQAIKRKSGSNDDQSIEPIPTCDSDSGSSLEGAQNALTLSSSQEARARSSTDVAQTDQLSAEIIPRSNSYSPAGSSEAGYILTTHKKLDPSSQHIVSSDPILSETSTNYKGTTHKKKLDPVSQQSPSPQHGTVRQPSTGGSTPLRHDIHSIINNMGDGLEFCEKYSKKLSHPAEAGSSGSAPSGLRLPVPFELKQGSSQPNLVRVGFELSSSDSNGGPDSELPNGLAPDEKGGASDSSTGSEGEEQGSSEREEGESSLDQGVKSRYEIKKTLCESSDKVRSGASLGADGQNPENLVVTSLMYADAVWDRVGIDGDDLSFRVGDVIEILDMSDDTWWQGNVREKSGWFPSAFVRLRVAQDEEDDDIYAIPPDASELVGGGTLPRVTTMPAGDPTYATYGRSSNSKRRMTIRRKDSCPSMPQKLTPAEVRSKVVEEILNTERDYVQHLKDIIEGFLKKCRLNTKLFDREKLETIFSNIESLYEFQVGFLQELEARVSPGHMEDSQIGGVFVSSRDGFAVYSEYCNNHPHAVNEMCVLQKKEQYAFFFESCRLLRNLQNIPLEGFLLLPVQKICKYPLQLSELLKYTSEDHPDREAVEAAVAAMRQVATHINEGKRRLENIGRIGKWQESIDGWKGPDIVETSTEMIHSSELHKISKGHSQERHFFLFDKQLIYCKKDAIGGKLCYKGRLAMDTCHVTDLPDGQETHNGAPVKYAWKMDNQAKGKDYIIYAKTPEVKMKWMEAFQREKQRVTEDKDSGFHVSLKMKRAAAALCSSTSRVSAAKRRRSFNKKQALKVHALSESVDSGARLRIDGSPARERKGKFSIMKQIF